MKTMNKIALSVFALLFSVLCFSCADGIKDVAGSSSDWSSGAGYSWGSGSSSSGSTSASWIAGKTYKCASTKISYTFYSNGTVTQTQETATASNSNLKYTVNGNIVTVTGTYTNVTVVTFTSNENHTILTDSTAKQEYTLEGN